MVRRLWLYTQTDCVAVVTAAYKALASYSVEHFKISHYQFKVTVTTQSYRVNSWYLEVVGTIFYKFKLPEVQINLHFG